MKLNQYVIGALSLILLSGCYKYKKIEKGSYLYKAVSHQQERHSDPSMSDSIFVYEVQTPFKGTIKDKTDYLLIEGKDGSPDVKKIDEKKVSEFSDFRKDITGKYFYADKRGFDYSRALRYWDSKFVLQGMSIPLKIRKELVKDSLPKQADATFNVGVAIGWKFNYNAYKATKNIFAQNAQRVSFTPGFLLNIGTVDLVKNVNALGIINNRKEPVFTWGGFAMFGYNSVNLGVSIGQDFALGDGKTQWRYNKKRWFGFIVAIDLIK